MFTEKNIPKLIILTPIITVILISFFNIYFFIKNQNNYFKEESKRVENEYITKQKNVLKREIESIINYINFQVNNNKKLSVEELKNQILRYTETIRYGKNGYIWIHDTSYFLRAHPFRKNSINTYDISLKDAVGSLIIKEFVNKTVKKPNGVFIEYYWQKPENNTPSKKLGFFRLYKKYNWVIGAGLYIDDIQNSIDENKLLLEKRIDKYIKLIVFVSFFVMILIGFISYLMSRKISEAFKHYQENVQKKELLLEDMNKNLEKKVQVAIEEVQKKDRAMLHQSRLARMGAMLSMIAHQWRQPLSEVAGILMELETASKFKKADDILIKESVEESNKLIQFMSYTIDDFRNFFKPDKKKVYFYIEDSCMEAISLIRASIKNSNIKLHYNIKMNYEIYGYKREFAQVLLNLMSNAKDILNQRKIENPRIDLEVDFKDGYSIVTVQDNANGVEEEHLDLIFEPYFTTKSSTQGTGLGLYMSKMIIEKNMGGELSVENTKDGALFKVKIKA
ncbi:integral membrane sensor signal transduction histidine kinase [Arcobacter nitrofigilis DSM 7299]|uniref:histidine kinase n=1 Tax=Arcobacter nitrofigilis (strain ATCC 33309 / DSM 7299 / CCUG 15893 / LMG 7604 / NCTC 12251 / CI) TaxID=572480 RepID=D5V4N4_ARCNC|nr:cache domain-containing protein [Arcobacter nitrofigilis]ADG92939.1 integral membrane sensor signal transduction histidine kinase [Arcobacter nitrofigilis DSM 7299]